MKNELISVVKGDHNLLKINFIPKGDLIDLVILLDDEFVVPYIGQDGRLQTYSAKTNINNVHITYHSSIININNNIRRPELHLRDRRKILNIFDKIIDLNTNSEFPIPLFKIACKDITHKDRSTTENNSIDLNYCGGIHFKDYNITKKNIKYRRNIFGI
jgi:hypothetical protein